jgi:hypothetical protein
LAPNSPKTGSVEKMTNDRIEDNIGAVSVEKKNKCMLKSQKIKPIKIKKTFKTTFNLMRI